MRRVIALSDGNHFYCACHRVFDPHLARRPVIVLSNNDGCAVSRTDEAKALGIAMGARFFEIRNMCRREGVAAFSSIYPLYDDMSRRVNVVYNHFSPHVEIYSIDESFLDFTGLNGGDYHGHAATMRATVLHEVGIPTCVGIGHSKTLAKLANHTAKKNRELGGVCDFTDDKLREHFMARTPIEDLWGIGKASALKLLDVGVSTVADFRAMDPRKARELLTVVGERAVHELNGIPCLDLETMPARLQGTAVTRTFGRLVTSQDEVLEALATDAARAGEKLRAGNLGAVSGYVFLHTDKHNGDRWCHRVQPLRFAEATSNTLELVAAATTAGRAAYVPGARWSKHGVVLTHLVPDESRQLDFLSTRNVELDASLMKALDGINTRYGKHTLVVGAAGTKRAWNTRANHCSPHFTTRWQELPRVSV